MWPSWWALFPWYTAVPGATIPAASATLAAPPAENGGGASASDSSSMAVDADVDAAAGAAAGAAAKVGADMDASAGNGASPSGDVDTSAGGGLSVNGLTAAEEAAAKSIDLVKWPATGGVDPALEGVIKAQTIVQIKRWFSHQKTTANRESKNPFVDWLDTFERLHVPRKLPLHKFYMQREEYAALVEERFNEKWPLAGLETNFALDFRCKCAKELLDEEEEECRTNLATVVQPFLDGIAKLTGFHVTLLAGAGPPQGSERFTLTMLHAGQWDMVGFKKNVLGQFMRYLLETNEHSATREVPGTGGVTWAAPPLPPLPQMGHRWTSTQTRVGSGTPPDGARPVASAAPAPIVTTMGAERAWAKAQERLEVAGRDTIPGGVKKVIARKYAQPEPRSSSTAQLEPRPSSTADAVESYTRVAQRVRADAAMRDLLQTLPTNERRERVYQLARLGSGEFMRENALVRNKVLLEMLNLKDATRGIIRPAVVERLQPRPANTSAAQLGPTPLDQVSTLQSS
ncbi:hypothetical protein B0H14DRAFT_3436547 [Mycena olivaceomarginata]|nr:hypothetical protein B0H14DRAFT_3436547 [Mycena olivaceomarginata]